MLVLTMILLALLWFAVLSFSNASFHSLRLASAYLESEQAITAAESGLEYTLQLLRENPEYRPTKRSVTMNNPNQSFRVEMLDYNASPIAIPQDCYYLESVGTTRSGKSKTATAVIQLGQKKSGLFDYAIFSSELDLKGGSNITAFDSSGKILDLTATATIGTNNTKKGSIRLDSGVRVDGIIKVGPGGETKDTPKNPWLPTWGTENVVWKNWSAWTAGEETLEKEVTYDPIVAPEAGDEKLKVGWKGADVEPGRYRELQVSGGGQARLSGGTYVFDSIKLGGGGRIVVTGEEPVYVYIKKKLDLSNGSLFNMGKVAGNLIFLIEDKGNVDISGGTAAFATFYGPGSNVKISGGNVVYGTIVAESVKIEGGSQFLYDLALRDNPPSIPGVSSGGGSSSGGVTVLGWQRI